MKHHNDYSFVLSNQTTISRKKLFNKLYCIDSSNLVPYKDIFTTFIEVLGDVDTHSLHTDLSTILVELNIPYRRNRDNTISYYLSIKSLINKKDVNLQKIQEQDYSPTNDTQRQTFVGSGSFGFGML